MELETKRQLIHASGASFAFATSIIGWQASGVMFALMIIVGFLIAVGYQKGIRVPIIAQIVDSSERPEMIRVRPAKGALSFFLGALLTILLFRDTTIASAAIIILAFGDSFSTLIGRKVGKHKIPYNPQKSIEGSIAGLVFAFAGALFFVPPVVAALGAAAGMLMESFYAKIDDNITVPVFAGLVIYLTLI